LLQRGRDPDQPAGRGAAVAGRLRDPAGDRAGAAVLGRDGAAGAGGQLGTGQRGEAGQPLRHRPGQRDLLLQLLDGQRAQVLLHDQINRRPQHPLQHVHDTASTDSSRRQKRLWNSNFRGRSWWARAGERRPPPPQPKKTSASV
jgi:hypothetical protein